MQTTQSTKRQGDSPCRSAKVHTRSYYASRKRIHTVSSKSCVRISVQERVCWGLFRTVIGPQCTFSRSSTTKALFVHRVYTQVNSELLLLLLFWRISPHRAHTFVQAFTNDKSRYAQRVTTKGRYCSFISRVGIFQAL